MRITICITIAAMMSIGSYAQTTKDLFDTSKMGYKGTKTDQAKILLRNVGRWGRIMEKEAKLDSLFLELLSQKISFEKKQVKKYLDSLEIQESDIGGSLADSVSFVTVKNRKVFANYFVIHDVSTPALKNKFPSNINEPTWSFNNPNRWTRKITHTYLMRTGAFKTVANFSEGLRATKFELKILGEKSRGLYIHIELIQPRVYPPGTEKNAPIAPTPGFTDIQYKNLALLYVCASIRKGEWLIPAFHVNIDEGLNDGHDDPQNFILINFTNEVISLVKNLEKMDSVAH
jgi:hypothetical protein